MKKPHWICLIALAFAGLSTAAPPPLLNDPVDVSGDFRDFANTIFTADELIDFDAAKAAGSVRWQRHTWQTAQAFDNMLPVLKPAQGNEFPGIEYAANPEMPFSLEFVSPRAVRLRMASGPQFRKYDSL